MPKGRRQRILNLPEASSTLAGTIAPVAQLAEQEILKLLVSRFESEQER